MSSSTRTAKRTHLDDEAFTRRGLRGRRTTQRRVTTRAAVIALAIQEG